MTAITPIFSVESALDQYVLRLEEPRLPDQFWHPSSISGCARRAMYDYLGTERSNPHDVRASRVFRLGHIIHEFAQTAITQDPSVVVFYPEIAVRSIRLRVTGHADGLIAHATDAESAGQLRGSIEGGWNPFTDDEGLLTWVLVEIKSMNSMGFKYGDLPKEDHKEQAFIYMKILREEGGVVDEDRPPPISITIPPLGGHLRHARLAYVSKDDMLVGEYVVPWSTEQDDRLMAKLAVLEDNLSDGTLPDRLPVTVGKKGERKLAWGCTYCPYRDLCWVPGTTKENRT